jgi:putative transposase
MAAHMRAALVPQAVALATSQRPPAAGLLRPTDRGSQSGAASSRQCLTQHGIQPRMSRKGTCGDHAVAESFVHTLQTARVSLEAVDTHEQAQTAVCASMEVFYNRQRCHAAHGSLAPLAYAQALNTNAMLCPEKC